MEEGGRKMEIRGGTMNTRDKSNQEPNFIQKTNFSVVQFLFYRDKEKKLR